MGLLLTLSLVGSLVSATPEATDATAQSRDLFAQAQKLYTARRYSEALVKFEQVYALKPHPTVMFNIARCYEQMDSRAKALSSYRQYLRLSPDAADKQVVKDAIANFERMLRETGVQQVTIFAEPATARIEVDGRSVGVSPATLELSAGAHSLKVAADGFESETRPLTVSLAHVSEVTVTLSARAELKRPTADAPTATTDLTPSQPVASTTNQVPPAVASAAPKSHVGTFVAGGVAVAGLASGITFGVLSASASNALLTQHHSTSAADGLITQSQTYATVANVSYGVAGAAAITAVILFFVEGR